VRADVTVSVDIEHTPRILQTGAMFDVPPDTHISRSWTADLPIEDQPWSVGLIVGPSGAGKSSVARRCFTVQPTPEWRDDASVLDCFPDDMSIRAIIDLLTSVGFSSPRAWMRPYSTLSTGEQFRVDCARRLAEAPPGEIVTIDEFTSVVDRQVAQVASSTVAKTVRRQGRQLVAVTCHYDVVEWLQPDWIYQPHAEHFTWRSVQSRPQLELGIYPIHRSAWRVFAPHHYLSAKLHPGAQCFGGFINDECVMFMSFLHFMHPQAKNLKMGHRLVVLPDWQGLGLSERMGETMGQYLYEQGYRYRVVTAHPALIRSRSRSPRWKLVSGGPGRRLHSDSTVERWRKAALDPRRYNTYSFEYVAPQTVPPAPPDRGGVDRAGSGTALDR
jgi:GNAT superfamily N-acetyltransferase